MSRPVIVGGLNEGIFVVVCLDPPDAYASRNQEQRQAIEGAYPILQLTLINLHPDRV